METLNSSNLAACDYNSDTETLTIAFRSGATYEYPGVPEEVYESLRTSSSPGQYFNASIKTAYNGVRTG